MKCGSAGYFAPRTPLLPGIEARALPHADKCKPHQRKRSSAAQAPSLSFCQKSWPIGDIKKAGPGDVGICHWGMTASDHSEREGRARSGLSMLCRCDFGCRDWVMSAGSAERSFPRCLLAAGRSGQGHRREFALDKTYVRTGSTRAFARRSASEKRRECQEMAQPRPPTSPSAKSAFRQSQGHPERPECCAKLPFASRRTKVSKGSASDLGPTGLNVRYRSSDVKSRHSASGPKADCQQRAHHECQYD